MKKYTLPLLFVLALITSCKTNKTTTSNTKSKSETSTKQPTNQVKSVNNYDVK